MIDGKIPTPTDAEAFVAGGQTDITATAAHENPKDDGHLLNLFAVTPQKMIRYGDQNLGETDTAANASQRDAGWGEALHPAETATPLTDKLNEYLRMMWLGRDQLPMPFNRKGLLTEPGEKTFLTPPPVGSDQSAANVVAQTPWSESNSEL